MVNFDGLLIGSALFYKYWYRVKPSTINMSFFLICLQLKLISSLYGLRFGWTNRFTVSGNPISVSLSFFMSLSSNFFANFFEKKFLSAKRIIVLNELPRRWHALISDLWILMTIFPKTFIHLSSSSLFFTLNGIPSTTTLLRRLYWSILFRIILALSNRVSSVLILFLDLYFPHVRLALLYYSYQKDWFWLPQFPLWAIQWHFQVHSF